METFEVRARRQRERLDEEDVLRVRNRAARIAAIEFCKGCDDQGRLLNGRFCSHEVEGL